MDFVTSEELHRSTRQLLDRVRAGEEVAITVDGIPVARIAPLAERPLALQRDAFLDLLERHRADPGLATDLCALVPDTTGSMRP